MAADKDSEKTIAVSPEDLPTVEPEDDTVDAGATRVADAAETAVSREALTTRLPSPADPATDASAPDGIDALDDPYYAPAVLENLTTAHQPVSIPSPVESLPERKPRFPRWGIVLIVIVLLAAAGAVACLTYEQELWGGKTIPNVTGKTEEEATQLLEGLGFTVEVAYSTSDDNLGIVVGCDPVAGIRTDLSETVTITVTAERTIPKVVGMSVEEASEALAQAGAQNVLLTYLNSEQPAGTVLDVSPAEGSPFVSTDEITLTVAQAYAVPNVEGMSEEEACATLESEGLASSVTYVESDAERGTVVAVSPSVGSQVAAGSTIELSVSSPYPSSPTSLLEYFEVSPEDLSTYLSDEGYSLVYGATFVASGNALTGYESEAGDLLQITDSPESGSNAIDSVADVLAKGAGVGGVRYAFTEASLPEGGAVEDESGIHAVMEACGLSGLRDTCTQDDIVIPEEEQPQAEPEPVDEAEPKPEDGDGTEGDAGVEEETTPDEASSMHFICGLGVQDGYTWVIVIGGSGNATRVVAFVAPSAHFSSYDLEPYGGSLLDCLAYIDLFAE